MRAADNTLGPLENFPNPGLFGPNRRSSRPHDPVTVVNPKWRRFSSSRLFDSVRGVNDYADLIDKFVDIDIAYANHSLVRRSVDDLLKLVFRNDWKIKSDDQQAMRYVKERIRLLTQAMGHSFNDLLMQIANNAIKYHNIILVKTESRLPISTMNRSIKGANGYWPVHPGAIVPVFRDDPEVQDKKNKRPSTRPVKWKSGDKSISAERVTHISVTPNVSNSIGLPYILSAMPDIKMQRELEQLNVDMIWRNINPLLHLKVGSEDEAESRWHRKDTVKNEINAAENKVEEMSSNGWLVTSYRWNVDKVDTIENARGNIDYLEYFSNLVLSGLYLDPFTLGWEAGGTADSLDSLDQKRHDQAKLYQRHIETIFNEHLFPEWLRDVGIDPYDENGDPVVSFEFNYVDLDKLIKHNEHFANLFALGILTHGETREALGRQPDSKHEDKYFFEINSEEFGGKSQGARNTNQNNTAQN